MCLMKDVTNDSKKVSRHLEHTFLPMNSVKQQKSIDKETYTKIFMKAFEADERS